MFTARMHDSFLVEASDGCTTVRGLDAFSALHNSEPKHITLAPERPQRAQLVAGERMHARNAILLPSHMQQMVVEVDLVPTVARQVRMP
jgi:hypothetical protein